VPRALAASASGTSLRMGEAGISSARWEMGGIVRVARFVLRQRRKGARKCAFVPSRGKSLT